MEVGSMEWSTNFIHYFLCMIHPNEFNSGATLKFFDSLEVEKRKNKEFWEEVRREIDEERKKYHKCQCLYHQRTEEEPDEERDGTKWNWAEGKWE